MKGSNTMNIWQFVFMFIGVCTVTTWVFKFIDWIEKPNKKKKLIKLIVAFCIVTRYNKAIARYKTTEKRFLP